MNVIEVVAHVGCVPADIIIQWLGELVGKQLGALGGHVDDVRRRSGRDHGEDFGKEILPVRALDGLHLDRNIRVGGGKGLNQTLAGRGVRCGSKDGDVQGLAAAARNVSPGKSWPGAHRGSRNSDAGKAQQGTPREL